jgi:hypothetical protein
MRPLFDNGVRSALLLAHYIHAQSILFLTHGELVRPTLHHLSSEVTAIGSQVLIPFAII